MNDYIYQSLLQAEVLVQFSHDPLRISFCPLLNLLTTFVDVEVGGRQGGRTFFSSLISSNRLTVR